MTPEQAKAIRALRDAGWAVILWTPEELGDVEPEWVEECSISYASEYLIPDQDDEPDMTCDHCGAEVAELIGSPDGREVCRACFDQGVA